MSTISIITPDPKKPKTVNPSKLVLGTIYEFQYAGTRPSTVIGIAVRLDGQATIQFMPLVVNGSGDALFTTWPMRLSPTDGTFHVYDKELKISND